MFKKWTSIIIASFLILTMAGCGGETKAPKEDKVSTQTQQVKDVDNENTKPAQEPQAAQQEPQTQQNETSSQDEKQKLQNALSSLSNHFEALENRYAGEQKSYNSLSWAKWSRQWNIDLNKIKEDANLDKPSPNTAKYYHAKISLAAVSGDLFGLWAEYNRSLEGRDAKMINQFKTEYKKDTSNAANELGK